MPAPNRPRDLAPLLALAGGVLVTLGVAWLLADLALERQRQEFRAAARQAKAAVLTKVETSVALLRGTAGLFASSETPVTVRAFHDYVDRLALRERYPGILGLGFAQRIHAGDEEEIAKRMRAQGQRDFHVWPEESPDLRTTITLLEPLDVRNRAAIGYDMATNPVRREAMNRARDSGHVEASAIVELVQEIDRNRQPGFLLYLPVYLEGEMPGTVAKRRELLLGFAYSPIRTVDFLSSAFDYEREPSVDMAVYHGREPRDASLLYRRGATEGGLRLERSETVDVEGQPWTFRFRSRRTWLHSLALPAIVAAAGLALSALLAVLVGRERRARSQAQGALEAERAARGEAERANRMKDEFLATLSHELRTPLHAILGWTTLLRLPGLAEEKRRQGVDVIERNARAQSRLIEDLLDMNRIASGKLTLDIQRHDLRTIVQDAVRSMRPQFDAKGVRLRATAGDAPCVVNGDAARLAQVVGNLLSNAAKFTPAGGQVDVALARDGESARVAVRDTGEGIEPAFMERIFERFAQADASSARRHGGLGLGLSIVRQLVAMHGGSIRVESEGAGKGTTFEVTLPLAGESAAPAPSAARADDTARLRGVKVLAVDDDDDGREFVRTLLAARGAEVRTAASAEEALEALRREPPDVLLSDIGMPGTDGLTLMRAIRELPPAEGGDIPAAAITAYARDVDREAAREAGFDTHLVKPLRGETLVETVARLAEARRA
jgi:signal transduction histidine kinase/CheY-like chemotaxis protein